VVKFDTLVLSGSGSGMAGMKFGMVAPYQSATIWAVDFPPYVRFKG